MLNPCFTDWIMGWPTGCTDPLKPVTGWSRWLRRALGWLHEVFEWGLYRLIESHLPHSLGFLGTGHGFFSGLTANDA